MQKADAHPIDQTKIAENNINQFSDYYDKPSWWFKFRYDTQIKRKTCLYLIQNYGKNFSGKVVLEIGFGSGEILLTFEKDCSIFGIELSESAIKNSYARASKLGYNNANFYHATSDETLPFPDSFFDIVIASHVIEHVTDDKKMLSEIWRVIKSDGIAVVLIPINEKYVDPNHVHQYTVERFQSIASSIGLISSQSIENEYLFHLVEKFYYDKHDRFRKWLKPIIAALFNFPTAILPFRMYVWIEKLMKKYKFLPRQAGFVFTR